MSLSALKRFFRLLHFEDHLELARSTATASGRGLENYTFANDRYRAMSPAEISPAPLITGLDLIAIGFKPGPLFARILTRVEDEQLELRLTTRDEAIAFVSRHFSTEKAQEPE
jgi:poly(A) polymerase